MEKSNPQKRKFMVQIFGTKHLKSWYIEVISADAVIKIELDLPLPFWDRNKCVYVCVCVCVCVFYEWIDLGYIHLLKDTGYQIMLNHKIQIHVITKCFTWKK